MVNYAKPLSGTSTVFGLTRFQCMILAELFLLISLSMILASVFIPNWLSGGSSTFMYPASMNQGFSSRSYGLVYVEGLKMQSWAEMTNSVCDRWGLYSHTSSLFETAANCESSTVGDSVACTDSFETHLRSRCEIYSNMTLLSFIVVAVVSFSSALIALTSIMMLLVPMATMKRSLLAGLSSAIILTTGGLIAYGVLACLWFTKLIGTATYPMPSLSLGFAVAGVGDLFLIMGTFVLYRLSAGLRYTRVKTHVAHKNLLDLAEAKFVDAQKFEGDSDPDEETVASTPTIRGTVISAR